MDVQSHNPSNNFLPDFLSRVRSVEHGSHGIAAEELQYSQWANVFKVPHAAFEQQPVIYNGLAVTNESKDPQGNINQKRPRETACEEPLVSDRPFYPTIAAFTSRAAPVSTGLRLATSTIDNSRQNSPQPSTSGRQVNLSDFSKLMQTHMDKQREEVHHLIDSQVERMKLALEDKGKKYTRTLLSVIDEGVSKRLKIKDEELDKARKRAMELEERLKQMSLETQLWRNLAKNNELMALNLRQSLEQVVGQMRDQHLQHHLQHPHHHHISREEGCGESEVDDAESCQHFGGGGGEGSFLADQNKELREQRKCKFCRVNDVCILLLPCRHLCLCRDCEGRLDLCPLCGATKNASVQVYMT